LQPIGHVDFYPNGGIEQPGCRESVISHMRKGSSTFYGGKYKEICSTINLGYLFTIPLAIKLKYFGS
jgi:pancreatic triacylglycerol lipase